MALLVPLVGGELSTNMLDSIRIGVEVSFFLNKIGRLFRLPESTQREIVTAL